MRNWHGPLGLAHFWGLGLMFALAIVASEALGLPPKEALLSGAARTENGGWKVTPEDEASMFTPAGFDKPGKPMVATGENLGKLKLVVRDRATGKPTFCRVNVVGADGNYYHPPQNKLSEFGLLGQENPGFKGSDGLPRGNRARVPPVRYYGRFFYCSGEATVDVPPGPVRIEISKGYEYRPTTTATRITKGQTQTAEVTIERTLPMAEHHYYSGDPHLHFPRQSDADDERIFDLMEADDTHFGSIMVWNHPPGPYSGIMKNLLSPQLRGMGRRSIRHRGDYQILSCQEYRTTTYGHLNLFLFDDVVLPGQEINADNGPPYGLVARGVLDAGGYAFYAHGGYAQAIYADLVQGNINGVELLQFSVYRGMGLEDWYHVLNSGFRFPAIGACDYPYCRVLGDSKTYVEIDGKPDFPKWLEGAAAGRSFMTSGPMLLLEVSDSSAEKSAKPGAKIFKSGKGPQRMTARVRVRSENVPVTNLQIVVNGEVAQELVAPIEQGIGRWLTLECPLELSESSWIAARAFSKAPSGAPNAEAHTNPVYVYFDHKAPYREASLDRVAERIDIQIDFHRGRGDKTTKEVLEYFQRSRDIVRKMRAAGGVSADGHPSDIANREDAPSEPVGEQAATQQHIKELLKPIPPKSPTEALKTFETVGGFKMELVASEPLVCDPIAAEFDEQGQLYVCEMRDYPYRPKEGDTPLGTLRLLRDSDGDGAFDESHVFADGLLWAGGVVPWKGGVFVTSPPDIWYMKDTDGDFKADVRTKVFTGFGTQNQQAMLNNLKYGLDHKIYGATAANGGLIRPGEKPSSEGISVSGRDFRFDPESLEFETVTGTIQFGNTFDDWGNRFVCSESRPILHVVLPQHYLARNPFLPVPTAINNLAPAPVPIHRISPIEPWRAIRSDRRIAEDERAATAAGASHHVVDAAAGVTVYRGSAYPAKYYGNVFVGDSQNNLIHRRTLTPDGVTFRSERADKRTEFVRSSDNWFRPVNFVNAPDGTLYVLDMSRETIESVHIPSDVAPYLDLTSGRDRGRIYRLAPPGFQTSRPPKLGDFKTIELVAALEHPNGWHRDTAHRLIYERQDKAAVSPLRRLLSGSKSEPARVLVLWSLQGLNALTSDDLSLALADSSPRVREHAVRLAESRLDASPKLLTKVLSLAGDPDAKVSFQVAFSLGETSDERATRALAQIAKQSAADRWMRTAILSSAANRAGPLLVELLRDSTPSGAVQELSAQLAQLIGACNRASDIAQTVALLANRQATRQQEFYDRLLLGLGSGLKQSDARLPNSNTLTPTSAKFLQACADRAMATARNADAKVSDRQRAIRLLGCFELKQTSDVLGSLLDPLEPEAVQLAALDALGEYNNAEIAKVVLEHWSQNAPAVRTRATRLLLSRDPWMESYLAAVQNGQATATEIDAGGRTQLLTHRRDLIREMAEKLFTTSSRAAVIADYRAVPKQTGDVTKGRQVFTRTCAACHRLNDEGHAVGPDLTSLAASDPDAMLTNILDPNRHVAPAYMQYSIVDQSGRSFNGMIATETATSITLTRGNNVMETVLRNNIDEFRSLGQSLMPEGLEKDISKPDMADLLTFLTGSIAKHSTNKRPPDRGTPPGLIEPQEPSSAAVGDRAVDRQTDFVPKQVLPQ